MVHISDGDLNTGNFCLLFKCHLNAIIWHLICIEVKICYSDVSAIQMLLLFRSPLFFPGSSPPSKEGPAKWRVVYNNILEMRKERSAPVDSMGCERAQDLQAEPKVRTDPHDHPICTQHICER